MHSSAANGNSSAAEAAPPEYEDVEYRVVSKCARTRAIDELALQPVDGRLDHLPGQYALVGDIDDLLPQRSYSIANAPRPDGLITLLVTRVVGDGHSVWLAERTQPGDRLLLSGPYGSFVADPKASTNPVLYLAGGSGLAPIRALVEAALAGCSTTPSTLFVSARTSADLVDHARFRTWEAEHPAFRYLRTLTRAMEPPPAGRIPDILHRWVPRLDDHRVYIAGGSGFVTDCAEAAVRHGAQRDRVMTEAFFADVDRRRSA
jgi:CDP-4-dehydro-6-deoxyglucose reductase, E3